MYRLILSVITLIAFNNSYSADQHFIEVSLPPEKALCYHGRIESDKSSENYYYYVNYSNSVVWVNAELKEGHVDHIFEKQKNLQRVLDSIRLLKNKYNDKTINVKLAE